MEGGRGGEREKEREWLYTGNKAQTIYNYKIHSFIQQLFTEHLIYSGNCAGSTADRGKTRKFFPSKVLQYKILDVSGVLETDTDLVGF